MNLLRELRKFKTKSIMLKVRALILLVIMLIVSVYAWFSIDKDVNIMLRGKVTEWDAEYYIDGEKITECDVDIEVGEFYPGMEDFEKDIYIHNVSREMSNIIYEIASVKLFGREILPELTQNGHIEKDGNTINIFSKEEPYTFNAGFSYDKEIIEGLYVDDETTPDATAKIHFFTNWSYERNGNLGIDENDAYDTRLGKQAYEYYKNGDEIALVVKLKIRTARDGWIEVGDENAVNESIENEN